MEDLVRVKINLLCLIRLAKIELNDAIEDLKVNKEKTKFYQEKDPKKYDSQIKHLLYFRNILIFIISNKYSELQEYYKDLKKLENIKTPSESFTDNSSNTFNPSIIELNKLQNDLENCVGNLSACYNKTQKYNEMFKDIGIKVEFSQSEYYIKAILEKYDELNNSKLRYYSGKYPMTLIKK